MIVSALWACWTLIADIPNGKPSHLSLVTHGSVSRFFVWIRHRRHLRSRENDPNALGTQPRVARNGHGFGSLWNRGGVSHWRLARRPFRPENDVVVDWSPVHCGRNRLRLG